MAMQIKRPQRGGTVLGFIVGVLVGLAGALAVAVYVTKVPIPFSNRTQANSAEKEAAENQKNKNWDPNTPLYGKTPVRPATPASSGPVGTTDPATLPPAVAGRPAASAPVTAKADTRPPAASADPLGDLAKAKAGGTPAEPFSYFVQAGAFRTPEDAEAQRAKLSLMGLEAKVTEREQAGRTVFRVRLGPFDRKDDADKAKERLDGASIESALVRVQR
jgi:cell division protein FtsN